MRSPAAVHLQEGRSGRGEDRSASSSAAARDAVWGCGEWCGGPPAVVARAWTWPGWDAPQR